MCHVIRYHVKNTIQRILAAHYINYVEYNRSLRTILNKVGRVVT